jgi:hypothetical protein
MAVRAVWIVEWEYNRDGVWNPTFTARPSATQKQAKEKMRAERMSDGAEGLLRYRVRRYFSCNNQEPC